MKRVVSFLIEGIGYTVCMMLSLKHSTGCFEEVSLTAVFVIPLLAFAAANLLYLLLEKKFEGKMHDKIGGLADWLYPLTALLLTTALFLGFNTALEYLGNMPASFSNTFPKFRTIGTGPKSGIC